MQEFAKLFETDDTQVVVMLDKNEDDDPTIYFHFYVDNVGMVKICLEFTDENNDIAWDKAEHAFEIMDIEEAKKFVNGITEKLQVKDEV